MPQGGLEALEAQAPLEILAHQYDIVCNGVELSSGAIRNHRPEIMCRAFELDLIPLATAFPLMRERVSEEILAPRIFVRIAEELNGSVPRGEHQHRQLLDDMALDLPGVRPQVISAESAAVPDQFIVDVRAFTGWMLGETDS